jgi:hypothetical protein
MPSPSLLGIKLGIEMGTMFAASKNRSLKVIFGGMASSLFYYLSNAANLL